MSGKTQVQKHFYYIILFATEFEVSTKSPSVTVVLIIVGVLFLVFAPVIAVILCRKNRSRAETISSDVNPVYNTYYIEADPVAEVSTYGYM